MITTNSAALAEMYRLLQSVLVCPTLTTAEVQAILDKHKRASLWTATTAFDIGSAVIPILANRNGHHYIADRYISTGTNKKTGATEPVWSVTRDAEYTDGVIIWRENGYDWDAVLWDFISAAREGWLLKAAKATPTSDFQSDTMMLKASQLYDHCMAQAAQYQPAYVL